MSNPLVTSCVLLFVLAVAITDARTRKIPNLLTVSAALVAFLIHGIGTGSAGVLAAGAGLATGLGLFLPFFLAGGFGAGDVKAMAAVGAFLGAKGVLLAAAFTLVAGAVAGLLWLIVVGGLPALRDLVHRWALRVLVVCAARTLPDIQPPHGDAASGRFPYGVAIACGTVLSLT